MQHQIAAGDRGGRQASKSRCSSTCSRPTSHRRLKAAEAELKADEGAHRQGARGDRDRGRREGAASLAASEENAPRSCRRSAARTSTCSSACSRARQGIAVAEAVDGHCSICHVRLRPQVYNTILRNEAIVQCDHCQRILYFAGVHQRSRRRPGRDSTAAPRPGSIDHERADLRDHRARRRRRPRQSRARGLRRRSSSTSTGNVLAELYEGIGIATNNVAEYRGLLAALEWALDHGHTRAPRQVRFAADRPADARQLPGEARRPAAALPAGAPPGRARSGTSPSSTCGASRTRKPTGCRTSGWIRTL